MSKQNLSVETDGLSDIIAELNEIVDEVDNIVLQSANAYGEAGIVELRKSYLSNVKGAKVGDYIYESIGYRMIPAPNADTIAWGGVGVYEIESVKSQFGKTDKDLTAAQIAYWLEFGTTRLRSGARKPKKIEWEDVELPTVTIAPTPFISTSAMVDEKKRESAFAEKFNQLMSNV